MQSEAIRRLRRWPRHQISERFARLSQQRSWQPPRRALASTATGAAAQAYGLRHARYAGAAARLRPLFPTPIRRRARAANSRSAFLGTFDSLNPFNVKSGSAAPGLIPDVFQTLMTRSMDEPFTMYGLIAQSVETDEAARLCAIPPRSAGAFCRRLTNYLGRRPFHTFDLLKTKGPAATAQRLYAGEKRRDARQ